MALFAAQNNGDGVVVAAHFTDPAVAAAVAHAVAVTGGTVDRSGATGVNALQVEAWWSAVDAWLSWTAQADDVAVQPLGEATEAAVAAVDAVASRVEDWFTRSRLVAFDAAADAALGSIAWTGMSAHGLTLRDEALRALPLARLDANGHLPLTQGVNPALASALDALRTLAVVPLVGDQNHLDAASWELLNNRLIAFRAWRAAAPPAAVAAPGRVAAEASLSPAVSDAIRAAIFADEAVRPDIEALGDLARLVRWHRDFASVVDNMAAFGDFYAKRQGTFQSGTLVIDRRACALCIDVPAAGAVAAAASSANAALITVNATRGGKSRTVTALVTSGDCDRLRAGRNGLFWDRDGVVWDATITSVVDNPIGLRQAFWSPYKRAIRFVEDQINARLVANDAAATSAQDAGLADATAPGIDVGTVAAIGVAVGGITAAFGALVGAFFGLGPWMPLGLFAVVLLVSGPSVILAAWKLRTRTLAPLLDAVGWAINGDVRVNIAFGEALTTIASLPAGARIERGDPFGDRKTPWGRLILGLALIGLAGLWATGSLDRWLPPTLDVTPPSAPDVAPTTP